MCREISGCAELMACLEATQCLNLADCDQPEKCGAELGAMDASATGVAESLLSCRLEAQCACFEGPPTISCGDVTCDAYQPAPPNPIAQACCAGGNGDRCGLDPAPLFGPESGALCVELNQPGPLDAACPDHVAPGLPWDGATLPGCCKTGGTCGVLDDVTGLGCIERSLFGDASAPPSCTP
jgi:hypothetical protein